MRNSTSTLQPTRRQAPCTDCGSALNPGFLSALSGNTDLQSARDVGSTGRNRRFWHKESTVEEVSAGAPFDAQETIYEEAPISRFDSRERLGTRRIGVFIWSHGGHGRLYCDREIPPLLAESSRENSCRSGVSDAGGKSGKETTMENPNSTLGIFATPEVAQRAFDQLETHGMDLKKLSALAAEQHAVDHAAGYCIVGRHLRYWGRHSEFWDNLWSVLVGAGLFWTPSAGPVLMAGPLVALSAGALESQTATGGLGAVGAGLFTLGIPKHAVLRCESAVRDGNILMLFTGSGGETDHARKYFEDGGAVETHLYSIAQPVEA